MAPRCTALLIVIFCLQSDRQLRLGLKSAEEQLGMNAPWLTGRTSCLTLCTISQMTKCLLTNISMPVISFIDTVKLYS